MIIALVILIIILAYFFYNQRKIYRDLDEFTESILYKDFSRKYPEKGRNKKLYCQFNTITNAFQELAREKEAQQSYLKEILGLVDTGILAYNTETYQILWMNDSLSIILNIPHIKNLQWLKKQNEELFNELLHIPLNKNILITIHVRKQAVKTMTKASLFQNGGKTYKLFAFHNINLTMEEIESSAWKRLLNVMTHEIMNSIAPVTSLSDTLKKKIQNIKNASAELNNTNLGDIEYALETIHRRSEGLLHFAENYRSLSQKINPDMKLYKPYELISSIHSLMNPSMQQKGISFTFKSENPDVIVSMDRELIEQAIINFITNATYAVGKKENPHIQLFSGKDINGRLFITVVDNGQGISDSIRDKIFIPFFSTKKNGNGIGLSISREIVKLHNAEIYIQSKEKEGSAFTFLFNSNSDFAKEKI